METVIGIDDGNQSVSNALAELDPSFLKENPLLVNAYTKIKWDDTNSLNALISAVEQIVVKYKDPNVTIKGTIEKIYDQLLGKYPLFFGYWKRFTAVEYQLFGLQKSIDTLTRAVETFPTSIELWCDYLNVLCANNPNEIDLIRRKFRTAKSLVGYQFLSHTFWDKYIEFETKHEEWGNLGNIYQELVTIALHQYAKYGAAYKAYLRSGNAAFQDPDVDAKLRKTQNLVNAIWPFESKIKQSFFNLTPVAQTELQNWDQYLDFILSNRQKFNFTNPFIISVFERCLIPCFYYEHFWIRYVSWFEDWEELPHVVELYQRGSAVLPLNCKTFRIRFLGFLKKSFRINKDYVYSLFEETAASYMERFPSDAFIMTDYLALLKRHQFLSSIDQNDEEILQKQVCYAKYLETAITNYLQSKIAKDIPLQEMLNDINIPIVVVELIKITWLVLKNTMQARKYFIFYSKNPLMKSSVTYWLTYYKFEKWCQNYTKLNRFINDLGTKIFLPTAIVNDLLEDYRNFYLANSNVMHFQNFVQSTNERKEMDPILLTEFKMNDPNWLPGIHRESNDWHKTREFRENGHPGIIDERPQITNLICQYKSKFFDNQPPSIPAFRNLEKINQPLKYNDYLTKEYLGIGD
ncbi:ZYRO0G04840p [Zygosaccharomyces rouxii]|uniref:ZYRO0G04840p n=1 Tax=Zygosaccharomyces rouxii (strain ATCC 2623 / CBS 732 / NBRC 1130 / NCYC 568 / NRRL Y-229) TaxID=559307 RepID=C5DZJ0_ZYGRC|nr:uncharacterized protein ZYRO0G04840g [Zygosaccharomyces rouxii]KAH9202273.1 hypothetical protein LQ764DRAFT_4743 [Zygosaccharomyces rouxii]CAR29274.1 ZYRO0G04840p [Zygosaccharomyces rouxii]